MGRLQHSNSVALFFCTVSAFLYKFNFLDSFNHVLSVGLLKIHSHPLWNLDKEISMSLLI